MSRTASPGPRRPVIRRIWKPALAAGAGGTAALVWWEELLLLGAEILALIMIPILAGAVYLYNLLAFNTRQPRREDLESQKNRKEHNK